MWDKNVYHQTYFIGHIIKFPNLHIWVKTNLKTCLLRMCIFAQGSLLLHWTSALSFSFDTCKVSCVFSKVIWTPWVPGHHRPWGTMDTGALWGRHGHSGHRGGIGTGAPGALDCLI